VPGLLGLPANRTPAVLTSILAIGTPVLASFLAIGTPVLASFSAILSPLLAPLDAGRLGLSL
jgi:hypothetical protein